MSHALRVPRIWLSLSTRRQGAFLTSDFRPWLIGAMLATLILALTALILLLGIHHQPASSRSTGALPRATDPRQTLPIVIQPGDPQTPTATDENPSGGRLTVVVPEEETMERLHGRRSVEEHPDEGSCGVEVVYEMGFEQLQSGNIDREALLNILHDCIDETGEVLPGLMMVQVLSERAFGAPDHLESERLLSEYVSDPAALDPHEANMLARLLRNRARLHDLGIDLEWAAVQLAEVDVPKTGGHLDYWLLQAVWHPSPDRKALAVGALHTTACSGTGCPVGQHQVLEEPLGSVVRDLVQCAYSTGAAGRYRMQSCSVDPFCRCAATVARDHNHAFSMVEVVRR